MTIRSWHGTAVALSTFLLTVSATASVATSAPSKPSASAKAKGPSSAKKASKSVDPKPALTPKSFTAIGLANEGSLVALFRGDFDNVDFNREEVNFETLFQQYLDAYARRCSKDLPQDKVEMTTTECAAEEVTTNGWGVEVGRGCVRYRTVGTNLYAKPILYAAKKEVERLVQADRLRLVGRLLLGKGGPAAGAMDLLGTAQAAASDMNALVQMNPCSGPGLLRFEENLRLFALNERPVRLEGIGSAPAVQLSGVAFQNQDYAELIERLVEDQAGAWVVNRFVRESVTNVAVSIRDVEGRPLKIVGSYLFDGFNGRSQGSVSLELTEGSPTCLYFSDAPATCRTPNRKIVSAFVQGRVAGADRVASISPPIFAEEPVEEPVLEEPRAPQERRRSSAPVLRSSPPTPSSSPPNPAPRRVLMAVNYVQGIKDACLEVLTGGDREEPEVSYCFCLSASIGAAQISEEDARWLFENFSEAACSELEDRYPALVRRFASCRAQLEANADPG